MAGSAVVLGGAPATHRSKGIVRCEVALLCDASGVVPATVIGEFYGRLVNVFYDGNLDASAVVTLKDFRTGATILVHTTGTEGTPVMFRPTIGVSDVAGAVVTAADTAPNVNRDIPVAGKVTITVASGGNVETGKYAFVFDETPPQNTFDIALTV